jgi:hypothetical protein
MKIMIYSMQYVNKIIMAMFIISSFGWNQDCSSLSTCNDCFDAGCFWQDAGDGNCFDECMIADAACYGSGNGWTAECPDIVESALGYLREVEVSFCMDTCSQYYIEMELDGGFGSIPIISQDLNINMDLYVNRFVEVSLGHEVTCVECSAFAIEGISLSDGCDSPVQCFADPCEVASECQINTPVECISNYCGGCYADFYDLNGNLVDCNTQVVDCEDIEYDYDQLHSGIYTECQYDNDCIAVWGDCDVGLGGCHYPVNEDNYPEDEIDDLVELWITGACMSAVCDCSAEPYAQCINGTCTSAYCMSDNPAGCSQTGCDEGYECIFDPNECVPSWCGCSGFYGEWFCTEDCGGGTCSQMQNLGDINNDAQINVLDIVILVSFVLMSDNPTESEFFIADFNGDNALNVLDVVAIIQVILNPAELPEDCYIEPEIGPCDGICPTYYYNQTSNECEEFITGCCGIEAFDTMQECQNVCE